MVWGGLRCGPGPARPLDASMGVPRCGAARLPPDGPPCAAPIAAIPSAAPWLRSPTTSRRPRHPVHQVDAAAEAIALVASLWHGVFWPVLFFALAEGAFLAVAPRWPPFRRACDRAAAQEAPRQRRSRRRAKARRPWIALPGARTGPGASGLRDEARLLASGLSRGKEGT